MSFKNLQAIVHGQGMSSRSLTSYKSRIKVEDEESNDSASNDSQMENLALENMVESLVEVMQKLVALNDLKGLK